MEKKNKYYIALPNNMMSIMSLAIMVGVGPHLPIGRGGYKGRASPAAARNNSAAAITKLFFIIRLSR